MKNPSTFMDGSTDDNPAMYQLQCTWDTSFLGDLNLNKLIIDR